MYKECTSCVINNGHISKFFSLTRGLCQGCPLSPYLFIMVVEVLARDMARDIRENKNIEGIKIGHEISKIHQYVDDTF